MSRVHSTLAEATTRRALTRVGQYDYWDVLDRDTSAEIAITVDRSVTDREGRVIGFVLLVDGRRVVAGKDALPPWARASARLALLAARLIARDDAREVQRRRAYADQVLAGVPGGYPPDR